MTPDEYKNFQARKEEFYNDWVAEWEGFKFDDGVHWRCSECENFSEYIGETNPSDLGGFYNYCSCCGRKMIRVQ